MTAAFVLAQDVHLAHELGVGLDGTGLSQNLAALDVGLGNAAQQAARVITGNALVSESTDPNAPEYACIKELMDAVDSYIPTVDGNAALALLGSLVDAGVVGVVSLALERQELGDGPVRWACPPSSSS